MSFTDNAATEVRVVPDFTGFAEELKRGVDQAGKRMTSSDRRSG